MIKELKKLIKMWGNTFEKLFMMPFEKEDWKVNLSSLRIIWVIPIKFAKLLKYYSLDITFSFFKDDDKTRK